MLDHRKLEISFTNRLVDSDLANIALLYVQLQNRFIEVFFSKIAKDKRAVSSKHFLEIGVVSYFR